MNRCEVVTAAASAALSWYEGSAENRAAKRPNLAYAFADQLRCASCGYAGDECARTLNIDALAAQRCNLHRAIVSTPMSQCRASLRTGKYQSSTGSPINEIQLGHGQDRFAHALTKADYHTGYVGRWHMRALEDRLGNNLRREQGRSYGHKPPRQSTAHERTGITHNEKAAGNLYRGID